MKLITWNIQWGLGMDGRLDLARMVAHARALADFDVLCLQEVADNFPELEGSRGENQFAEIAALLPGYTAVEGVALDVPDGSGRRKRFGNMVFSRWPVGQVLRYTLPWEADVTRNMPRVLIDAVLASPCGSLRVMTTHLEYSSDKLRRAQVEGIREAHRTACARVDLPSAAGSGFFEVHPRSKSAILTGDFNMVPEDPLKRRISESIGPGVPPLRDGWEALHAGEPHPHSFCVSDQRYGPPHCCDFVFATEDLLPRLQSIAYDIETRVSDHQPVLIALDAG